jgi:diaminopimelate epimerase
MELHFVKLTGAGNDFVAVDNLHGALGSTDQGTLARTLCDRHFGIGADGLLVIESSDKADFRMMYYNADGSLGGMCGNGGRCAAFYARSLGLTAQPLRFEALDFVYQAEFVADTVRLSMKDPADIARSILVQLPDGPLTVHGIDTGSPHIVTFVKDLGGVSVDKMGRTLREHPRFAPKGTNVNFVQRLEDGGVAMRTYERGVEAETLACGTGSIASAVIAHLEFGLKPPIRVRTWSSQYLDVDFKSQGCQITDVKLQGPAVSVFAGTALYDPALKIVWV